jgi:hypothetical protein
MWDLLRDRTYIKYWLAVVVSFLGDSMTRIALIYLIGEETESPVMIATVVVAQLLPMGALAVFLGPLTDRFSKRSLLIGSDLARMVAGSRSRRHELNHWRIPCLRRGPRWLGWRDIWRWSLDRGGRRSFASHRRGVELAFCPRFSVCRARIALKA